MTRKTLNTPGNDVLFSASQSCGVRGERRDSCRYSSPESTVSLTWSAGGQYREISAGTLDVSSEGLRVRVDVNVFPRRDETVWVRLDDDATSDWIETSVVEVKKHWGRPAEVRLAFRETCPYDFFKATALGIRPEPLLPQTVASLYNSLD